jgi:hypothetical protein
LFCFISLLVLQVDARAATDILHYALFHDTKKSLEALGADSAGASSSPMAVSPHDHDEESQKRAAAGDIDMKDSESQKDSQSQSQSHDR